MSCVAPSFAHVMNLDLVSAVSGCRGRLACHRQHNVGNGLHRCVSGVWLLCSLCAEALELDSGVLAPLLDAHTISPHPPSSQTAQSADQTMRCREEQSAAAARMAKARRLTLWEGHSPTMATVVVPPAAPLAAQAPSCLLRPAASKSTLPALQPRPCWKTYWKQQVRAAAHR